MNCVKKTPWKTGGGDRVVFFHLCAWGNTPKLLYYTRKNLTTCQQDVFATGLWQACQQVVTMMLFYQVNCYKVVIHNLFKWLNCKTITSCWNNHRHTGGWGWGGCSPPNFLRIYLFGQKLSCHSGNDGLVIRRIFWSIKRNRSIISTSSTFTGSIMHCKSVMATFVYIY
jgi:hypothetical protein